MNVAKQKSSLYQYGFIILAVLAVLTVAEFLVAQYTTGLALVLFVIAMVKSFLIVRDYMHLPRLVHGDEEEAHE